MKNQDPFTGPVIVMKIAMPLFGERVSPHFGASSKILVVDTAGGKIVHRAIWDVGERGAMETARRLASSGVDKLICNGIDRFHKQWLILRGVNVVENQRGDAEAIVAEMIGGDVPSDTSSGEDL